eukprot:362742_1
MARATQLFENAQRISNKSHAILKNYFNYSTFRANQLDIITNTINGGDSLVVMGTGSGKSLCYQIPALISHKPAIVISPLLSLIQNQVSGLLSNGISAISFTSASNSTHGDYVDAFVNKKYSIIYLTPEGLESKLYWIKQLYTHHGISCFAVDEAHCISEWGIDFRPKYQDLSKLRDECKNVPIIAATATATEQVQNDIEITLKLGHGGHVLREYISSFFRSNLFISIHKKTNMGQDLLNHDYFANGSTIIYAPTRKLCNTIESLLNQNGVNAKAYHAGLSSNIRSNVQQQFENNTIQCVVATIAFGMGIDKSNVRHVIHWGAADSVEAYYQQIGRAGRDGKDSKCILFWMKGDLSKSNWRADNTNSEQYQDLILIQARQLESFVNAIGCRKKYISKFFGEQMDDDCVNGCDNCLTYYDENKSNDMNKEQDFTTQMKYMVQACFETGQRFGITTLVQFLHGKINRQTSKIIGCQNKPSWAKLSQYTNKWITGLSRKSIEFKYLAEIWVEKTGSYQIGYKRIYVTPKGHTLLAGDVSVPPWIPERDMVLKVKKSRAKASSVRNTSSSVRSASSSVGSAPSSATSIKASQINVGNNRSLITHSNISSQRIHKDAIVSDILVHKLQKLRKKIATKNQTVSKNIISDAGINYLCQYKPISMEQLKCLHNEAITPEFIDKWA